MSRVRLIGLFGLLLLIGANAVGTAAGGDLLIRNATVHTADTPGSLQATDVIVRDGRIAAIGARLTANANAEVVDAQGRPLTPGLFAGINGLGLEDVSLEPSTLDHALSPALQVPPQPPQPRPEFDVLTAFNPLSVLIPITRVEGYTFAAIAPSSVSGGSFLSGQGALVSLDGSTDAELAGSRTLYVHIGADADPRASSSRAAQWMLLEQAVAEAKQGAALNDFDQRLLSAAGRSHLGDFLGARRIAFRVERAADILQVLTFSKRHGIRPLIVGGAQAWLLAAELARQQVPVLIDPFLNLPGTFEQIGAGLDNAATLHAAGVAIAFFQNSDPTQSARKLRQGAGIAVAHGLPWDAALVALTAAPAAIFGLEDRGRIAVGRAADLVLWSGDPLEVTTFAEKVWIDGAAQSMRSRQTELRDRYLHSNPALPRAYTFP